MSEENFTKDEINFLDNVFSPDTCEVYSLPSRDFLNTLFLKFWGMVTTKDLEIDLLTYELENTISVGQVQSLAGELTAISDLLVDLQGRVAKTRLELKLKERGEFFATRPSASDA